MHDSVMAFVASQLPEGDVRGKDVLEVGSYDVNGSPRNILAPRGPAKYVGVDVEKGPGVDEVCQAADLAGRFGENSFDVVLSTEMLEHVDDWISAVSAMKKVLKDGGILVVTTRSPGFKYHPHPIDAWRYTMDDMSMIFADMEIVALQSDPEAPGVFMKARKPFGFVEAPYGGVHLKRPLGAPPLSKAAHVRH